MRLFVKLIGTLIAVGLSVAGCSIPPYSKKDYEARIFPYDPEREKYGNIGLYELSTSFQIIKEKLNNKSFSSADEVIEYFRQYEKKCEVFQDGREFYEQFTNFHSYVELYSLRDVPAIVCYGDFLYILPRVFGYGSSVSRMEFYLVYSVASTPRFEYIINVKRKQILRIIDSYR